MTDNYVNHQLSQAKRTERTFALDFVNTSIAEIVNSRLPHPKLVNQKVVFKVLQFGSTYLGVENSNSDLDLVLTIFDCLFD